LVTGGTGFVGRAVVRALLERGDLVTVLTREADRARASLPRDVRVAQWSPPKRGPWMDELEVVDGVVHLAGATVLGRWNARQKRTIDESRGTVTDLLVDAIGAAQNKPAVLVSASAVGYYGDSRSDRVDESAKPGRGFLADVTERWEAAAKRAEEHDVRNVRLRLGVVFGPGGGALQEMLGPMRMFVGGPIGKGDNYISWVYLDDVVGMALMALDDDSISGPLNCTSPFPTTARELAVQMGSVLGRPRIGAPGFVAGMMFGEAAEAVTGSLRVAPSRALELGYEYHKARLLPALEASLHSD
jgi:uncharacterized protein (TIGR01777 family)